MLLLVPPTERQASRNIMMCFYPLNTLSLIQCNLCPRPRMKMALMLHVLSWTGTSRQLQHCKTQKGTSRIASQRDKMTSVCEVSKGTTKGTWECIFTAIIMKNLNFNHGLDYAVFT